MSKLILISWLSYHLFSWPASSLLFFCGVFFISLILVFIPDFIANIRCNWWHLTCSSVISPCSWLILHLRQKQMSRMKLQLVSHVFCPFSGLFPPLLLKCLWLDFSHSAHCTFVSHICILPPWFPWGFHRVSVWCKKFTCMFSDALQQSWRRIERERATPTVRMTPYVICICVKDNGIFFPKEFLFAFKLLLSWIHLDWWSSPIYYANVFAFCYPLIVNKEKILFILICLKRLN